MTYQYNDGLETDRLITRFLKADDHNILVKMFENFENYRYFTFLHHLKTPNEKAHFWLEGGLKRYEDERYGLQWLIDKQTGEYVGQCGLLLQDIDEKNELEVGYSLFMKYWGLGYATEAAKAFHAHGLKTTDANSIISIIDIDNIPSQKVAMANNMTRDKQVTWMNMNVGIYRGPNRSQKS